MDAKLSGTGFVASVEDNKLHIIVDLTQTHGKSHSGKSMTVATTNGNVVLDPISRIKLGLNVYRPV